MESEQDKPRGVIVKRVSLAALAALALIVAAGCKDAVTSPQLGADSNLRYSASNPPPPPIETGASGSWSPLTTNAFSIQQGSCSFSGVPVRYMFNNQTRAGYVHFESSSDNGVTSSSNGMVKFAHNDFSGAGTLEILGVPSPCLIVIDLSSVDESSNFNDFSFFLFFNDALLYECGNTEDCDGIPGSANMSGFFGDE